MQAGSNTPKATTIRGYAIPPVPSFRGGRLDTPADISARHQSRVFPSPQRLKVQAAIEQAQSIQERIKIASTVKDEKIAEVEAILAERSKLSLSDQESRLQTATSGSTGADYRRRAQAWTCLAKLAQKQNCPERAISYLQEALIHKAQPKSAIEQTLRDLYVQNGGSIADLLHQPEDPEEHEDTMESTPVSTPITNRLQERLREHDKKEELRATTLQFGTPRAEKISLLKTKPLEPYIEEDTPSPTPAHIVRLSEILEKAYIEEPPLDLEAKKENIPLKNPFDASSFLDDAASPTPSAQKTAKMMTETPNTVRRVRRSLRLAKRLNY